MVEANAPAVVTEEKKPFPAKKRESFEIETRIGIHIDFDLAVDLGEYVLACGRELKNLDNPALYALAIKLAKLGQA